MIEIKLTSLGGAETVTGSKHLLNFKDNQVLIDCGLFQGEADLNERNHQFPNLDLKKLKAVIITHAHLDHCGYLPYLIRKGYVGPIFTTSETLDLMTISLEDSAKLFKGNKNDSFYYDLNDVHRTLKLVKIKSWDQQFNFLDLKITFFPASHILGSSFVNFIYQDKSITFSGDLGRYNSILHPSPASLPPTDSLIVESTYGTKLHSSENPKVFLKSLIKKAIAEESTIMVPAFAIDRTQILLFLLSEVVSENNLNIPIILTGNMGIKVTNVYKKNKELLKLSDHSINLISEKVRIIEHSNELKGFIEKSKGPQIIVAGSGMLSGGTIVSHLAKFAGEKKNHLLITGYQAEGTPGRRIVNGEKKITMDKVSIDLNCQVHQIKGLSAHCDFNDLKEWINSSGNIPKNIYLVHGEIESKNNIYDEISNIYLTQVTQVCENTEYIL